MVLYFLNCSGVGDTFTISSECPEDPLYFVETVEKTLFKVMERLFTLYFLFFPTDGHSIVWDTIRTGQACILSTDNLHINKLFFPGVGGNQKQS